MRISSMLFLILTFTTPPLSQKQTTRPPSILTLITANLIVKSGSDVWVEVRWTNTSDSELNANRYIDSLSGRDFAYLLDVRDSAGHALSRIPDKSPVRPVFDAQFATLKPQETIANNINLSKLYNLSRAGKYTIQVSRRIPESPRGDIVKSNVVTITVTP